MDCSRVEVFLHSRIDHFVLLDQALAGKLLGLDTDGEMISTGTHKIVDGSPAARQRRLD